MLTVLRDLIDKLYMISKSKSKMGQIFQLTSFRNRGTYIKVIFASSLLSITMIVKTPKQDFGIE